MKKSEIAKLVNAMKYQKTDTLNKKIASLEKLEAERDTTKSMYFWSGFGNATSRKAFVARYSRDYTIPLTGEVAVKYQRKVDPSRNNAYASDSLELSVGDTTEKFTTADAKKIASALREIVAKR